MEKYNYLEAMKSDIRTAIDEKFEETIFDWTHNYSERDAVYYTMYEGMFVDDSITGNASGSYTFNTWQAEENICHNLDLLSEACEEFGDDCNVLKRGAESCDVTIRCYLLDQALNEVLDELEQELEFDLYDGEDEDE